MAENQPLPWAGEFAQPKLDCHPENATYLTLGRAMRSEDGTIHGPAAYNPAPDADLLKRIIIIVREDGSHVLRQGYVDVKLLQCPRDDNFVGLGYKVCFAYLMKLLKDNGHDLPDRPSQGTALQKRPPYLPSDTRIRAMSAMMSGTRVLFEKPPRGDGQIPPKDNRCNECVKLAVKVPAVKGIFRPLCWATPESPEACLRCYADGNTNSCTFKVVARGPATSLNNPDDVQKFMGIIAVLTAQLGWLGPLPDGPPVGSRQILRHAIGQLLELAPRMGQRFAFTNSAAVPPGGI